SSRASTPSKPACRNRSTCWSRRSGRWASTSSWSTTEHDEKHRLLSAHRHEFQERSMKGLLDLFRQFTPDEHFDAIKIGLACPEKIRSWSFGEINTPNT